MWAPTQSAPCSNACLAVSLRPWLTSWVRPISGGASVQWLGGVVVAAASCLRRYMSSWDEQIGPGVRESGVCLVELQNQGGNSKDPVPTDVPYQPCLCSGSNPIGTSAVVALEPLDWLTGLVKGRWRESGLAGPPP